MSMQMDAKLIEEQIGTLFVWVGALDGGLGGWVVLQGCPRQKIYVPVPNKKKTPPAPYVKKGGYTMYACRID